MKAIPLQDRAAKHPRELLLYYPYLFSEWTVEYKPFIGRKKTDRRFLMTNLVKGETTFLDQRLEMEDAEIDPEIILSTKWTNDHAAEEGQEFLRRHYVHKVRSWSVPGIKRVDSYQVFLPYEIYLEEVKKKPQLVLYESISRSTDKVDRYPEIKNFLQRRGVCS
ncbi:hypothetical protein [Pseudalkalibacillus decolorationis]|uniref:hypothetical protein n=1 Tax=Pseudalkalibacillus decolorationis TaxID=163879 RepID=UPI002148EE4C|nr:hypothetical protein [Pseudalkalibacillus decolorationis]